jgi:branched-chain amino acid transport system ATP-binding protein/branched-chain amino acid transport system permease protein
MNVLHGYAGQISIGHGAFFAIGAYVTGILTVDHGWPAIATVVPAVLITAGLGAVMCLPALRLSRWYLGMITLAMAVVIDDLIASDQSVTGGGSGLIGIPPVSAFGHDFTAVEIYLLFAALVAIALLLTRNLRRSPKGLAMVAIRESEIAAESVGVSVVRTKFLAFVLSAALAGLGGVLWAVLNGAITPDQFNTNLSILFLLIVLIGGDGRLFAPILGVIVLQVMPESLTVLSTYRELVYGALLLVIALFSPSGLAGLWTDTLVPAVRGVWERARGTRPRRDTADSSSRVRVGSDVVAQKRLTTLPTLSNSNPAALSLNGVTMVFGGLRAVSNVTLDVRAGSTHGLIGPNGSGKTTLLNVVSGIYRPTSGAVLVDGEPITQHSAAARARAGIARTFQLPRLLDREDVITNLVVGAHRLRHGSTAQWIVRTAQARRDEMMQVDRALSWLDFMGVTHLQKRRAGDLSHGDKRLIEVGRAMMSEPRLLLLDEPAAGISHDEIDRLADLIRALQSTNMTIILVEHHLDLVTSLSEQLTVMNTGGLVASGIPSEVIKESAVIEAYMGKSSLGR